MARRKQPRADSAASPPNAGANSDCPDAQVFPGEPKKVAEQVIRLVGTVDPANWERLARRLCKHKFFDHLQEGDFVKPDHVLFPLGILNDLLATNRSSDEVVNSNAELRKKLARRNRERSEKQLALERKGLTDKEIAAELGCKPGSVRRYRSREGRRKKTPSSD
jgi:DNA-directed RNA polymerase specialized sigma24 family protein